LRLEAITIEKKRKEAVTRKDFTSNKKVSSWKRSGTSQRWSVYCKNFFWIIDESIKIVDETHPEAKKLGKSVPCYERISARKGVAFEIERRKEVGQKGVYPNSALTPCCSKGWAMRKKLLTSEIPLWNSV
jgi:hypothetical protein